MIFFFGLLGLAKSSWAADFYIAQTQLGSGNASSCINGQSAAWFNTAGNWQTTKVTGKIGAGDTVHLCGTFISNLNPQASGSAGSLITVLWEPGAKMSAVAFAGAWINISNISYMVFDGGTDGMIENTGTGSNGGKVVTTGFYMSGATNIEIKNLTFKKFYVITPAENDVGIPDFSTGGPIYSQGGNTFISIHDNKFSDIYWAINMLGPSSNINVYNNTIDNYCHGVNVGTWDKTAVTNWKVHNNTLNSSAIWNFTPTCHPDGIYFYHDIGKVTSSVYIYNNTFNADGIYTASIFMSGSTENSWTAYIFNNVFTETTASNLTNGAIAVTLDNGVIANNTLLCNPNSSNYGCYFVSVSGGGNVISENNVVSGCIMNGTFIGLFGTGTYNPLDYNLYANSNSSSNAYVWHSAFMGSFSAWKTASGEGIHSVYAASTGLSAVGIPPAGSAVIGAGANLTSLGIAELNSDKNGISRPSSGAWDIGAYEYVQGGDITPPSAPTGLNVQ